MNIPIKLSSAIVIPWISMTGLPHNDFWWILILFRQSVELAMD